MRSEESELSRKKTKRRRRVQGTNRSSSNSHHSGRAKRLDHPHPDKNWHRVGARGDDGSDDEEGVRREVNRFPTDDLCYARPEDAEEWNSRGNTSVDCEGRDEVVRRDSNENEDENSRPTSLFRERKRSQEMNKSVGRCRSGDQARIFNGREMRKKAHLKEDEEGERESELCVRRMQLRT